MKENKLTPVPTENLAFNINETTSPERATDAEDSWQQGDRRWLTG